MSEAESLARCLVSPLRQCVTSCHIRLVPVLCSDAGAFRHGAGLDIGQRPLLSYSSRSFINTRNVALIAPPTGHDVLVQCLLYLISNREEGDVMESFLTKGELLSPLWEVVILLLEI